MATEMLKIPLRIANDKTVNRALSQIDIRREGEMDIFCDDVRLKARGYDTRDFFVLFDYLKSIKCPFIHLMSDSFETINSLFVFDGEKEEIFNADEIGDLVFLKADMRSLLDAYEENDMQKFNALRRIYQSRIDQSKLDWEAIHNDEKRWDEIDNLRIVETL